VVQIFQSCFFGTHWILSVVEVGMENIFSRGCRAHVSLHLCHAHKDFHLSLAFKELRPQIYLKNSPFSAQKRKGAWSKNKSNWACVLSVRVVIYSRNRESWIEAPVDCVGRYRGSLRPWMVLLMCVPCSPRCESLSLLLMMWAAIWPYYYPPGDIVFYFTCCWRLSPPHLSEKAALHDERAPEFHQNT